MEIIHVVWEILKSPVSIPQTIPLGCICIPLPILFLATVFEKHPLYTAEERLEAIDEYLSHKNPTWFYEAMDRIKEKGGKKK